MVTIAYVALQVNLQNQQCCSLTGLVVFYVILLILWGNNKVNVLKDWD